MIDNGNELGRGIDCDFLFLKINGITGHYPVGINAIFPCVQSQNPFGLAVENFRKFLGHLTLPNISNRRP
jgi:hypothetical protein